MESIHWPIESLDEHFISTVNQYSRNATDLSVKNIREFEEIQVKKEKEVENETNDANPEETEPSNT